MGLFDKILGGQPAEPVKLTPAEGVIGVILMAIAADGEITEEEQVGFLAIGNRMELLSDLSSDQFTAILRKLQGVAKKEGAPALLAKAAAALSPELRETAFALAIDLVLADGTVEDEEKAVAASLQAALQISDDLAVKIVEVLAIKNRG